MSMNDPAYNPEYDPRYIAYVNQGRRDLRAALEADPDSIHLYVKVFTVLASDPASSWEPADVVREWAAQMSEQLDLAAVDVVLRSLAHAGLVTVMEENDGEESCAPVNHWNSYAVDVLTIIKMIHAGCATWLRSAIAEDMR